MKRRARLVRNLALAGRERRAARRFVELWDARHPAPVKPTRWHGRLAAILRQVVGS